MKWLFFSMVPLFLFANEPFFSFFTPPKGWLIAPSKEETPGVKIGFIESSKRVFSPSITLTLEKVGNIDPKTYIQKARKLFEVNRETRYQELGIFRTDAGAAHLVQIDMKNQWGEIRLLQAILIHEGYAVIQTAASLKKDFLSIHETFLKTFKSLTIFPTLLASCEDPIFGKKVETLMTCWKKYCKSSQDDKKTLFESPFFQNNQWKPFVNYLEKELNSEGSCFKLLAIKYLKETLLTEN